MKNISENKAELAIVFIHGWCCSPADFQQQVQYFTNKYSILVPSYASVLKTCDSESTLFNSCSNYITNQILNAGLKHVILIGHSMGGVLGLSVMNSLGSIVKGYVAIDTTMPSSLSQRETYVGFLDSLLTANGRIILEEYISRRMINLDYDNADFMKEKKNAMMMVWAEAPEVFTQLLREAVFFDSRSSLTEIKCPMLYIGGAPVFGDVITMKSLNNNIRIKEIESGHFVMLNKPQQVNELLNDFILKIFAVM